MFGGGGQMNPWLAQLAQRFAQARQRRGGPGRGMPGDFGRPQIGGPGGMPPTPPAMPPGGAGMAPPQIGGPGGIPPMQQAMPPGGAGMAPPPIDRAAFAPPPQALPGDVDQPQRDGWRRF